MNKEKLVSNIQKKVNTLTSDEFMTIEVRFYEIGYWGVIIEMYRYSSINELYKYLVCYNDDNICKLNAEQYLKFALFGGKYYSKEYISKYITKNLRTETND